MSHRFFIPPDWITPPAVTFQGDTARQIRKVLRMRPGEAVVVLDNSGREWQVALTEVHQELVQGQIISQQRSPGEPTLHLTLYQGTLKAQKFELILQQGTEVGISRFVPTLCQRSVASDLQALDKKRERWQRIIKEAAEVNGRGVLPHLEPAMSLEQALRHAYAAPLRIMLWEEAAPEASLRELLAANRTTKVALFSGPEGGFTAEEAGLARQLGCQPVKLGPRILRAETAGLAASAAIFYELGDWD